MPAETLPDEKATPPLRQRGGARPTDAERREPELNSRRSAHWSRNSHEKRNGKLSGGRVRRTAELMTNPMSIALMVLWAISCEGALALNILADVFQSQAPAFPLSPTIATSVGLNVLGALLTALLGRWALRHFHLYQPFVGGQSFVVMQGFGYGILVTSSVILALYVSKMSRTPDKYRYGVFSVLGAFGVIANIILMASLLFFVPKRQRRRSLPSQASTTENTVWWRDISASPNAEIGLVVCFCVVLVCCSSVGEYYPRARSACACICSVFLFFGIFTIHGVIGYKYTPGYYLFMPNAGTLRMSLMQAFGWFLGCVSANFNVILYNAGESSPASWHILGGLASVISLCTLLLFVRMHRFPTWACSETSLLGEYGPLMLTLVSAFQASIVWGVALLLSSGRYNNDPQLRQGLIMCQTLSSLFTFVLPPCTHLLGRIAFGQEYEVWSPFKGPLEFLVLQGAGWTCFGSAIFFATLQITEHHHFRFVIIQSSLLALSQGFIHASLRLFEESRKGRKDSLGAGRSGILSQSSDLGDAISPSSGGAFDEEDETSVREAGRSLVTTVLNGEMLTAILLSTIGLFVRVVADVAVGSHNELGDFLHIPTSSLLKLATVISFVVLPLAHVSVRDRISIVTPFVGCGGYVAMQSIGWSLYAVNIVIAVANTFVGKRKSLLLPLMDEQYVFLEYTMEGLFATVPLVCIIMGAFFETNAQSCKKSLQERTRLEVLELFRVLQRAIPEEEELRHAEELLKAIAGPRWIEPPATDGARLIREDAGMARVRQEAATHIVTILSVAGALAFTSAAFLVERQPVFTLVFGAAGLTVTTISCFSVHYVYGAFLHRASGRYSVFMPFSGGPTFVALQAVGWGFYSASSLLIVMSCAEGRGSAVAFATAGVFSVTAQYCILHSVPRFDPSPHQQSVLERNAEGILAVLTLIGSFTFAMVHDARRHGSVTGTAASLPVLTLLAVSTCFAVPLGLVSLRRQSHMLRVTPFSIFDTSAGLDESEDISDYYMDDLESGMETPDPTHSPMSPQSQRQASDTLFSTGSEYSVRQRSHTRSSVYMTCFLVATGVALVASLLLPFALVYVAYGYLYGGITAAKVASNSLHFLLVGFAVAVLLPMFAPAKEEVKRKSLWQRFRGAFCCYAIYSIPTLVVGVSLSLPLFVRTMGASSFMASMVTLSCVSTIPYIQPIVVLCNVCFLGYLLHYHLYLCLSLQDEPFVAWKFLVDAVSALFWVWYFRRYAGRPHVTGRLMNLRAKTFFRHWFFEGIADYFNLRIVVDGKCNEDEKTGGSYVDFNDPANKYLLSFHPHGVFPGSAAWVPNTPLWERELGCNSEHYVTTHCADVVFSVPIMRDFVMCNGGMSVARRGIENSLVQGNSPLIVTGGQAEMLLTRISDTEMHLVTHHSGFVRLALLQRVPLVPVICFAENNVWGNIHLPSIQEYTVKKIGFPFPTLPYGRWYLPLPTTRPLFLAVGQPLLPEEGMDTHESPEHVERYRQRYFEHLAQLFLRYREEAGYPIMVLVLHHHDEITHIG